MATWPALELGRITTPSDLLQAAFVDHDVTAIEETASDRWVVFFRTAAGRDAALASLGRQFPELSLTTLDVPDEDWATRSQSDLRPICIGRFTVSPPWEAQQAGISNGTRASDTSSSDTIVIVIAPSMGFGTGHHATTRLCLEAIQQADLHERSVIDVGTGSGILAIAASLLGASRVVAVDDDVDAIQSARDNISLNAKAIVELHAGDIRSCALPRCDIVLANLTGSLLSAIAPRLQEMVNPDGLLILSGYLADEEQQVLRAFSSCSIVRRSSENEWVCATLRRQRSTR
jgi:ribosomal protein L11 methyltransferase